MTITSQSQLTSIPHGLVELFILDCTAIGGSLYRFTPLTENDGAVVMWQGNAYIPLPIRTDGWEYKSDGSQAKPTLSVANVKKVLLSAVIELGDLVGATLTRYRTFANYLDNGADPDPNAYFPPDQFVVEQKVTHDNQVITWQLSSVIDRMGIQLPRRQVTKQGDSRYGAFPGVGSYRPVGL